jgi:transposase
MVDWLWERHGIFVAFLPIRPPELNPIELVWNYLVQKLRSYPLEILRNNMRSIGKTTDALAYAAKDILDGVSHHLIEKFFIHCYKDRM